MEGYRYLSPMMGEITESLYESIELPYREFLIEYNSLIGKRQFIMPALLRAERYLSGIRKARDVYESLIQYGFPQRTALSAVRLFVANDIGTDSLVRRGRSLDEVSYTMSYAERMSALGIEAITINAERALESEITVRPIRIIAPVVMGYWRTSMAYAYSERKKTNRQVEIRIWHQSYGEKKSDVMAERELNDKWNEAMDALYKSEGLPDGLIDILDRMEEAGVEIEQSIDKEDLVGDVCTWYAKAIFWRGGAEKYFYDIFKNMNPQKEPLLKKDYTEYVQKDITDWAK